MSAGLQTMARKLGAGSVAYFLYYTPKRFIEKMVNQGPVNLALANRGREEMRRAAAELTPLSVPASGQDSAEPPRVYFLTGAKFWYQTLFCAYSLAFHAGKVLRFEIYDDGTLGQSEMDLIKRALPDWPLAFHPAGATEERLDRALPADRFPALRKRRIEYPHLRKLTDFHAGQQGWKAVLDSDMLFFRRPDLLLSWLEDPKNPFHMVDVEESYGYSRELMQSLSGSPVPVKLNVGIIGLNGDEIDWEALEHWTAKTIEAEGTSYFQEQALCAMLVGDRETTIAPEADYVCLPGRREAQEPTVVLQHYVAESKAWYFRFGWRSALANWRHSSGHVRSEAGPAA